MGLFNKRCGHKDCDRPLLGPGACPGHTYDRSKSKSAERDVRMRQSKGMTSFGGRGRLVTGSNLSGGKKVHK